MDINSSVYNKDRFNMKIRNIYYVITGLLLVLTTACQDDVND